MKSKIRTLAIAVFLTASYRLVPLPINDTLRAMLYAVFVFLFSNVSHKRALDISFFKITWPLLAIMVLTLATDFLLARMGTYLWVVWIKFLSTMLIAASVYALTFKEIHRLILQSIALLIVQLAIIKLAPTYFIYAAGSLGIVDPFITYGKELDRVYYAYFNANSASYALYYFMLGYFAVRRAIALSRLEGVVVVSVLIVLALLTGGRGVILLTAGFLLTWFASFRSTGAVLLAGVAFFGAFVAIPLYNAVIELVLLREESNVARLDAMKEYVGLIMSNPIFGIGIEGALERVNVYDMKVAHNFFLESVGMFGIPLGSGLLVYLMWTLVVNPKGISLRVIGFFAMLVGIFNSNLLATWGFFAFLVPVLLAASRPIDRHKRSLRHAVRVEAPDWVR